MLPDGAWKKNGRGLEFDARAVVEALLAYRGPKAVAPDGDPLLGGSDSPNLEVYRGWKAKLAQLDFEERNGTHANISLLDSAFVRFGSLLRRAGEILQRRWGSEAADVFNEALDEAQRVITAELNAGAVKSD